MIQIKNILKSFCVSRRGKAVVSGVLALVVCGGVVSVMSDKDSVIPKHDGDILVDSLNISCERAEAPPAEQGDTSLVLSDGIAGAENTDAYFDEARATITIDRNQIISMLTEVIAQAETTAEKDNAVKQKLKIIDYMDKEKIIENLIETKGLPECLLLITDNAVNVTVKKQELTQSEIAKICDIIMRETGRSANQIVIQSKI